MNALYIGAMVLMSLHADPWPESPNWVREELCNSMLSLCDTEIP